MRYGYAMFLFGVAFGVLYQALSQGLAETTTQTVVLTLAAFVALHLIKKVCDNIYEKEVTDGD